MIKSMTAFGKASEDYFGKKLNVEIRSLNSKSFDLNLKIPSAYRDLEVELRGKLATAIERGKTDVFITEEALTASENRLQINHRLAAEYLAEIKKLEQELKLDSPTEYLSLLMRIPDLMQKPEDMHADEIKVKILELAEKALKETEQSRLREGKLLETDLLGRLGVIETLLKEVSELDSKRIPSVKERIEKHLKEAVGAAGVDRNRLEQELIYYIEKIDVSEEKVRLKAHCDYFRETLKEKNSVGRKLNFISQELGREINTIGSKANDAGIQKLVVRMKDELEKIKEQALNVL